ncbi:hypothetical protein RCL1_009122 [Eukaryota sp. TZLM3-RCL]
MNSDFEYNSNSSGSDEEIPLIELLENEPVIAAEDPLVDFIQQRLRNNDRMLTELPEELLRRQYRSISDIRTTLQNFSHDSGFTLVTKNSKVHDGGKLCCKHFGNYESAIAENNRKRRTSTTKTDCTFEISFRSRRILTPDGEIDEQESYYEISNIVSRHNHDVYPQKAKFNKLTDAQRDLLSAMIKAKVPVDQTMASLKELNYELDFEEKDIHNYRTKTMNLDPQRLQTIGGLLQELHQKDFIVKLKYDPETMAVTHLYFFLRDAITMFRKHPFVLQLDCTYNTNR